MNKLLNKLLVLCSVLSLAALQKAPAADLSLPPSDANFVLTWNEVSNSDVTFTDVPPGYAVQDGTYLGWCVEMEVPVPLNELLSGRLLNLSIISGTDWNRILYILNHKEGGRGDVQLAIWYFTDNNSYLPPAAQSMVDAALSNGANFVPGPGQLTAIALIPNDPEVQQMIIELPVPAATDQPGTGTPGYWKNHPNAWPVTSITVGGRTYTKAQAIALMKTPIKGDKSLNMFQQFVSAALNIAIGNDSSCIEDVFLAADAWLAAHPAGSNVKANSSAWKQGSPLHTNLDEYNNGRLCAPHRD
jgi:hypothetical protein